MRVLACLAVLAIAGSLLPGSPAAAAAPLKAYLTCDGETGAIATWTSGNLLVPGPPTAVTVELQRTSGTRVTATTSAGLAPSAPFVVTARTTTAGDLTAVGYTGTFNPVTPLYYREKLVVTFKNPATGAFYATREATCDHDQRTTATLDCDPAAGR